MKILVVNGSPRPMGNSTLMAEEFARGALEAGGEVETIRAGKINIQPCAGCLRCNLIKKCALRADDWQALGEKIQAADVLVFATPIYFHHLPGPLKLIIDRFRSFIRVQITETGLLHTPWQAWKKKFILLLCLGSSSTADAQPVLELFQFMTKVLGADNQLTWCTGTRLAVARQILMTAAELEKLYPKLRLPPALAESDYHANQTLLCQCYELGKSCLKS